MGPAPSIEWMIRQRRKEAILKELALRDHADLKTMTVDELRQELEHCRQEQEALTRQERNNACTEFLRRHVDKHP
ncbi:MAG: hypothetical protein JO356_08700 [Acidobacteria bacterium]|nr:hypothetical protein [Acidobacteriota bacterium]